MPEEREREFTVYFLEMLLLAAEEICGRSDEYLIKIYEGINYREYYERLGKGRKIHRCEKLSSSR